MARCKNKKLIGPYIDGQLGECQWLDEHIGECPECMAEYEAIQRIAHIAARADFAPPESNYWKNFPTRVTARIAARQRPKFYIRIVESVLGSKLLLRIAAPVVILFIGVIIFKMNGNLGSFNSTPQNEANIATEVPNDNVVDINSTLTLENDVPESTPSTVILPEADNSSVSYKEEIKIEPSKPVELVHQQQADNPDEINQTEAESSIIELSSDNVQLSVSSYPKQVGLGLSDLNWTELARIKNFDGINLNNLNTDQVIKYQILAGSNSSLVPLSSHREAAVKYFAPKRSLARYIVDKSKSSNWGYATGDNNYDSERLSHLILELKLSQEK